MSSASSTGGIKKESVWDYPRPPALEPTKRHLKVVYTGSDGKEVVLADTTSAFRVLETRWACASISPDETRAAVEPLFGNLRAAILRSGVPRGDRHRGTGTGNTFELQHRRLRETEETRPLHCASFPTSQSPTDLLHSTLGCQARPLEEEHPTHLLRVEGHRVVLRLSGRKVEDLDVRVSQSTVQEYQGLPQLLRRSLEVLRGRRGSQSSAGRLLRR